MHLWTIDSSKQSNSEIKTELSSIYKFSFCILFKVIIHEIFAYIRKKRKMVYRFHIHLFIVQLFSRKKRVLIVSGKTIINQIWKQFLWCKHNKMNTACLSSCRIGSETNLYRATHTFQIKFMFVSCNLKMIINRSQQLKIIFVLIRLGKYISSFVWCSFIIVTKIYCWNKYNNRRNNFKTEKLFEVIWRKNSNFFFCI